VLRVCIKEHVIGTDHAGEAVTGFFTKFLVTVGKILIALGRLKRIG